MGGSVQPWTLHVMCMRIRVHFYRDVRIGCTERCQPFMLSAVGGAILYKENLTYKHP